MRGCIRLWNLQYSPCGSLPMSSQQRMKRIGETMAVPPDIAPEPDDLLLHVLFALGHEGIDLAMLAQALPHIPVDRSLWTMLIAKPVVGVGARLPWSPSMAERRNSRPRIAARGWANCSLTAPVLIAGSEISSDRRNNQPTCCSSRTGLVHRVDSHKDANKCT